jgi:hypothetical protein
LGNEVVLPERKYQHVLKLSGLNHVSYLKYLAQALFGTKTLSESSVSGKPEPKRRKELKALIAADPEGDFSHIVKPMLESRKYTALTCKFFIFQQ